MANPRHCARNGRPSRLDMGCGCSAGKTFLKKKCFGESAMTGTAEILEAIFLQLEFWGVKNTHCLVFDLKSN